MFFLMLMDLCHLFDQVMVLAELFLEMLQRDFGYRIYKMLLSLPEKVVAPPEPEKEEAVKEEEVVKEEAAKEPKDEVQSEGTAAESDAPPVSTSPTLMDTGAVLSIVKQLELRHHAGPLPTHPPHHLHLLTWDALRRKALTTPCGHTASKWHTKERGSRLDMSQL